MNECLTYNELVFVGITLIAFALVFFIGYLAGMKK